MFKKMSQDTTKALYSQSTLFIILTHYSNKIHYNDNLTGTKLCSRGDCYSEIMQEYGIQYFQETHVLDI